MNFIPTLSPVPSSFKGLGAISADRSAETIASDPLLFDKLAHEKIGGHGWASMIGVNNISDERTFNDPRWFDPTIYPGYGKIDWKWLKGDKFVFIFDGPDLQNGKWVERWFFDDLMKSGLLSSKSWKYYDIGKQIHVPDDPWILNKLKTSPILQSMYDVGKVAKPIYDETTDTIINVGTGIKETLDLTKYLPYAVGAAVLLWILSKRK